jgi:class 3 adenylate cyclase
VIADVPRVKLSELVGRFGTGLSQNARQCKALLADVCGNQFRGECAVLVAAVEEGVAGNLLSDSSGLPKEMLLKQLSQRLQIERGLSSDLARWSVESWSVALGVVAPDEVPTSFKLEGLNQLIELAGADGVISAPELKHLIKEAENHGVTAKNAKLYILEYATAREWRVAMKAIDGHRRHGKEAKREAERLRMRLQAADRQIGEYRSKLVAKEQEIERHIVRAARGSHQADRDVFASILFILFIDIVGWSLVATRQREKIASLLWHSSMTLSENEVTYMSGSWGDAVVFAYDDPNAALRCAFGLSKTLGAHGYSVRAALTAGWISLIHNPIRGSLDIMADSVNEAARLEPAIKQLDGVSVVAAESFFSQARLDEKGFSFEECKMRAVKAFGISEAGAILRCYKVSDGRHL